MPGRLILLLCPLIALTLTATSRAAETYHPLPPPADPSQLGVGVQRTMTLLATSTPEKRNKVRILFYGQSITRHPWTDLVVEELRKRFPHADIEAENRSISGFASQLLIRPAEHDVYPFYPDLLIFHVYGANTAYEELIKNVRSRTTAEVLMQKDHLTRWLPEVIDQKDGGVWWDHLMNNALLPEIAKKYGCGLADVRQGWIDYLKAHNLQPQELLSDDVHLNDHGGYLMASLIQRELIHRPDLPKEAWQDMVRAYEVGKDLQWNDGQLVLEFEGNRVDLIAAPGEAGGKAQVLIDGKSPLEFPGCWRVTRPEPGPWSPLFLSRVGRADDVLPRAEEWTLTIKSFTPDPADAQISFAPDGAAWSFEVVGSITGPDGAGTDDQTFISNSGRVKIEPEAWFRGAKDVPVGYQVKWKVEPMAVEEYEPSKGGARSSENITTVAQGLPNAKHTLTLKGDAAIQGVRIYRPPVAEE